MAAWAKKSEWSPAASAVSCRSSDGTIVHARPLRLTRLSLTFEFGTPECVLRTSEALSDLRIVVQDNTIYSGRGVIRSLTDAGTKIICETTLDETGWKDLEVTFKTAANGGLRSEFKRFVTEWQKLYKVMPQYKIVVADLHSFLTDLQLWTEQVELATGLNAHTGLREYQVEITEQLAKLVLPCIDGLFEKFETAAARVEPDLAPAHYAYVRRQLHPIVLCAPFVHRCFHKPLGYAGDYETVNMMMRNRFEGNSLFARMLNAWFLSQAPTEGHRNRLVYLREKLSAEAARVVKSERIARFLSLGCGPAQEIQQFMAQDSLSDQTELTLVDFSKEALDYVQKALTKRKLQFGRRTKFEVVLQSAQQLLRQKTLRTEQTGKIQFDFIYCGGLFDYLSDRVCRDLFQLLYQWIAPGGLLLVTNLHPKNPWRYLMEHLVEWHLIYRTGQQLVDLAPSNVAPSHVRVHTDRTGTNIFLELRKPHNA